MPHKTKVRKQKNIVVILTCNLCNLKHHIKAIDLNLLMFVHIADLPMSVYIAKTSQIYF